MKLNKSHKLYEEQRQLDKIKAWLMLMADTSVYNMFFWGINWSNALS